MLKREFIGGIVIPNTCVKLYQNWIINEVANAMTKGKHKYVRDRPNFVVRGDNNALGNP